MTMYERKPPVIEAVQWDGTLEGFDIVRELFEKSSPGVEYQVITSWVGAESGSRINYRQGCYDTAWQTGRAHDWFILHESGKLEWLDPLSFSKTYKEIEDDSQGT